MREAILRLERAPTTADLSALIEPLMAEMFAQHNEGRLAKRLRAALMAQSGWLATAGHERTARYGILLAESLQHMPMPHHPLLRLMVEIGLMLLLNRRFIR